MRTLLASVVIAGVAMAVPLSASAGPMEDAIKARQAVMQIYAFNLGKLGAMAKGEM